MNVVVDYILLVVEDNVRKPNVLGRDVKCFDTAVFLWVPFQLVVEPFLINIIIDRF